MKHILHFYFDPYTDYFWMIQQSGISIRSSLSDYWRDVSLNDIGISSTFEIIEIGSSPNYIWINTPSGFIPINPLSGIKIDNIDSSFYNY